ncbi:hypothetical protein O9K51_08068 [Purpureocillium lavendulum]|uniref:Uncharacterized protein n=1 Tax=Purpureocillium lavendulum TaxID=1247861 RepID=A0AB34FP66_9HYPO|nr:hypothetical protein O9K51_08068 [Purpureocillium lavendulum]
MKATYTILTALLGTVALAEPLHRRQNENEIGTGKPGGNPFPDLCPKKGSKDCDDTINKCVKEHGNKDRGAVLQCGLEAIRAPICGMDISDKKEVAGFCRKSFDKCARQVAGLDKTLIEACVRQESVVLKFCGRVQPQKTPEGCAEAVQTCIKKVGGPKQSEVFDCARKVLAEANNTATGGDKSAAGGDKTAAEGDKTATEGDKSATEENKTTNGVAEPATEGKKPKGCPAPGKTAPTSA